MSTYVVSAAVGAELSGEGNGSAEPEDVVQGVERQGRSGVEAERLLEGSGDQEEERDHGEDGAEHGIVDDGRRAVAAAPRVVDHVTGKRHDEQGPEELLGTSGQFFALESHARRSARSRARVQATDLEAAGGDVQDVGAGHCDE